MKQSVAEKRAEIETWTNSKLQKPATLVRVFFIIGIIWYLIAMNIYPMLIGFNYDESTTVPIVSIFVIIIILFMIFSAMMFKENGKPAVFCFISPIINIYTLGIYSLVTANNIKKKAKEENLRPLYRDLENLNTRLNSTAGVIDRARDSLREINEKIATYQ